MKNKLLCMAVLLLMIFPACGWAAGTVAQTQENYPDAGIRKIIFTCTGDAANGSIPNTDTDSAKTIFIKGWALYQVDAYPTAGGTAPDAADVFVLDANTMDLLGSEDGGATAYAGLNLIHATLKRSTVPNQYLARAGLHVNYYPVVTGALTLKVLNQATASANYTVVLTFIEVKER